MKLPLRLILLLMLPLVSISGVYSVLRAQQEARIREGEERTRAAGMARTIQIAVENAVAVRTEHDDVVGLLDDLTRGQRDVERIRILDRDGQVLAASTTAAPGSATPADAVARIVDAGTREMIERHDRGKAYWVYVLPMRSASSGAVPSSPSARRAVEITMMSPDAVAMGRQAIRDVLLRVGALTAVFALLIAVVLQRQVFRPLAELTRSIRALGEGKRGPSLAVDRRDELGELAEAFNRMTDRLEEARLRLMAETEHALELEQQLRRSETLAVAGKLASAIAHEVGTPLNIISGRAEMVLASLPDRHPAREDLERIILQIDRMSNIVRSLLDSVRIGKLEIHPVPIALLIGRLLPLLDPLARRRGIAVTTDIPDALPDVAADPARLQQVFINLLMNAVEASPTEGRVSISARPRTIDGRDGVSVEVADTGAGIPADALSQVFEPFYTTKPAGHGTGLGLAISRDIVRDHGGAITADNRSDRGAAFTVWLPAHGVPA